MTSSVSQFDPKQALDNAAKACPLCQQANLCAATTNTPIEDCWCQGQTFPPKATLANSMQSSLLDAACICQSCLESLKQP
jgi:hypothetical protein